MTEDENCDEKVSVMELFIDSVKSHPIIYALTHPEHKNQSKVSLAWDSILQELKRFPESELVETRMSTVKELKAKWHYLRCVLFVS